VSKAFPANCSVLIVEYEPIQAIDLSCILTGFGCTVIGPCGSAEHALQLLDDNSPNFALMDSNIPERDLMMLTRALTGLEVPLAVLVAGRRSDACGDLPGLYAVPRIPKPYTVRGLRRVTSQLHRADLCRKIAAADRRISDGRRRLADQIRLLERLESAKSSTTLATALLRELASALRVMQASRTILSQQLDAYVQ
jgi:CheY-like chemotaxis protein